LPEWVALNETSENRGRYCRAPNAGPHAPGMGGVNCEKSQLRCGWRRYRFLILRQSGSGRWQLLFHMPGHLPSKEVMRNVSRVVLIAGAVAVLALVIGSLVGAVIVPWVIASLG
jgi:hypothetical protein